MKLNVFASFALLALSVSVTSAQDFDKVGVSNLSSQRLSGKDWVAVEGDSTFAPVSILVTVGVDGKVLEAEALQDFDKVDPKPALAAAREWIFRPQVFDGHPVQAVGEISISYEVPEIPADPSVPFPEGALSDTEIELSRSACLGVCSDYKVSISGDGTVRFSAGSDEAEEIPFNSDNVVWPGKHVAKVDSQAVAGLIEQFRAAHFMGLRSDYEADITDGPNYWLTLRVGKVTKRVNDYFGQSAGMPANVTALESAVDALAKTDRWVRGNAETVTLLKAQGFDFKSRDAALMVSNAIKLNSWHADRLAASEVVSSALAEGLDLSVVVNSAGWEEPQEMTPIGVMIAKYAAWSGNESLFDEMTRRGQVARMSKKDLDDALHAGAGCSAKIAKTLVASGANINAHVEDGNALRAVRSNRGDGPCGGAEAGRRVEMVRALIDLGIPLEAYDGVGPALAACDDTEVVQMLLMAGADPNARDAKGKPILFSVYDDRVAVLLLRAGADPRVKDGDKNLSDRARELHWPATSAWLEAHGIR